MVKAELSGPGSPPALTAPITTPRREGFGALWGAALTCGSPRAWASFLGCSEPANLKFVALGEVAFSPLIYPPASPSLTWLSILVVVVTPVSNAPIENK